MQILPNDNRDDSRKRKLAVKIDRETATGTSEGLWPTLAPNAPDSSITMSYWKLEQ